MSEERMIWLDGLRLTAGLSMVGLHCTADPQGLPWVNYAEAERVAPLLMRAVFYTARTELFLIISAFLLLLSLQHRVRSFSQTLKEQAQRLLLPFAFWTLFYAAFNLIKASHFGYSTSLWNEFNSPLTWLGYFVLGDVKYHMHFLPTLFALILFYPLFRKAVDYPSMGALVIFCLIVKQQLDAYLYAHFWGTEVLGFLIRCAKVLTYVGYGFVAAAALGIMNRHRAALKQWWPVLVYTGALLFTVKLVATERAIRSGTWPFDFSPGYWADFLMPALLFGCVFALGNRIWPRSVSAAAKYAFGIYLCHPIFVDLCEIVLQESDLRPVWQVLLKIGFVLPCTTVLVIALSRVALLSWTVGLGPAPRIFSRFLQQKRIH